MLVDLGRSNDARESFRNACSLGLRDGCGR
jgi:hypothetical protein